VLTSAAIISNVTSSTQKTTDKLAKVQHQNNGGLYFLFYLLRIVFIIFRLYRLNYFTNLFKASASSSLNQPKDGAQTIVPSTQHVSISQQQPTALNLSKSAATANVQNTLAISTKVLLFISHLYYF
jgi:hypothetical protein